MWGITFPWWTLGGTPYVIPLSPNPHPFPALYSGICVHTHVHYPEKHVSLKNLTLTLCRDWEQADWLLKVDFVPVSAIQHKGPACYAGR